MDRVKFIQFRFKIAQNHKKTYNYITRMEIEFEANYWVYLKFSPMKGVVRFFKKENRSPRYIGPYIMSKMLGNISYEFELPQELAAVIRYFTSPS